MSSDPYSDAVRELFAETSHSGQVSGGMTARAEAQGVQVELSARAGNGQVEALNFRAWGCPHLIAAAEAFCRAHETRPVEELIRFKGAELMQSLAVPVEKTGRILVLEDAAHSLGRRLHEASATQTDH